MRKTLTVREQRIVAVLILMVVLAVGYWILIGSWFIGPLADIRQQIDQLRVQQQHNARLLNQRTQLEKQLQQARNNPLVTQSLLPGDDPTMVAADLMTRVTALIDRLSDKGAGCSISQRMPITPENDDSQPYAIVEVSLMLSCSIEPLMAILHDIEYTRPYLFVETLSIRRGGNAPASGGAGRLDVQLLVKGYMRKPAGKAKSS